MEEFFFGKRLIRIKWHLPKYIVLNSFLIFSAWQPFNEMTFEHTEYLLWVSFSCWCVLSQKHCVLVFSVSGMVRQWQCVRLKTRFLSKWESHKPTPAGSHHYCRTAHIKQIIIIIISSPRTFLSSTKSINWVDHACGNHNPPLWRGLGGSIFSVPNQVHLRSFEQLIGHYTVVS